MKKVQTFLVFLIVFLIYVTSALATDIVEVGREYGVNLTPLFIGQEAYYIIAGGEESAGEINFSVSAEITRVESVPIAPISRQNNKVVIDIPVSAKNYEVKVYFRAQKSGLIDIHLLTKLIDVTIWLKVLPPNAPLPWDVNWDGAFTLSDVESVLRAIRQPSDTVSYFRCDVNNNGIVNSGDLAQIRRKLGLDPYDFNDDGVVDISDWAFAQPQQPKVADQTGDNVFDINDLVLKLKNQKDNVKPAPSKPLFQIATTWGRVKQ